MGRKTKYFLKNYLLNFGFKKDKCPAYSLQETERYYRFGTNVRGRNIIFNIAKTRKLDVSEKCVLKNACKENTHTLLCCYEVREAGPGIPLFRSSKGFNVATYCKDVKGGIEVDVGVNLIDEVFYHLSAMGEYKRESNREKIQPYYFEGADRTVNEPLVDDFYNLFTDAVNTVLERFDISEGMQRKLDGFNVSLTHDVDAIKKDYRTSMKYLSFLVFTFARKWDFNAVRRMYRYLSHDSDFNRIIDIVHMEKGFGDKSTFFLYSNVVKKGLLSRVVEGFVGPSYDIRDSSVLADIRDVFNEAGFEVGLHSSYPAALNYELLEEEFDLLKRLSHNTVISNRNHFLNFSLTRTPLMLEKAGIKCDTTFYYNNICGFMRHKTCSPFYFYSHQDNRIVDVIEIPTVIMDSTLFNYLSCTDEDAYEKSIEILDKVRERKGVVCINWHNETSAPEYGWYSTYQDVLRWMKDNGACTYTIKEVYDRLTSEG